MASKESLEKNVNHPLRYTKGKVECIDALESAVAGKTPEDAICVANVIKYLWRYEEKEPLRSLLSARWYLDRLIGKYEAHTTTTTPDTMCQSVATGFGIGIDNSLPSFVTRDGSSTFNGKVLCTSLEDEQHTMTCSTTTPCTRADDDLTGVAQYCGPRLEEEEEETSFQRFVRTTSHPEDNKVDKDMVSQTRNRQ